MLSKCLFRSFSTLAVGFLWPPQNFARSSFPFPSASDACYEGYIWCEIVIHLHGVALVITKERIQQDQNLAERTNMSLTNAMKLVDFVLGNNYFKHDGHHYKQIFGCAIGSPISPALAVIVMEVREAEDLSTFKRLLNDYYKWNNVFTHLFFFFFFFFFFFYTDYQLYIFFINCIYCIVLIVYIVLARTCFNERFSLLKVAWLNKVLLLLLLL